MDSKELLLKAIDEYEDYTLAQRKILKILITFAVNDVSVITPSRIVKLIKTTRATVYTAIKRFNEDNFITLNNHNNNEKITKFNLNKNKLKEIVQRFETLQKFERN